jgi:hypothetical protein
VPTNAPKIASMIRTCFLLSAALVLAAAPALAQPSSTTKPAAGGKPAATSTPAAAGKAAAKPDPKAAGKADAKAKPAAAKPGASPAGGQATLLASFGDWGAYATPAGKSRICYALSQPKDRQPASLQRDPGYIFVSFRPAENVKNEIAVMMGFPTKDGGAGEATIGTAKFNLVTKDRNAWVKNPAEEAQVVGAMGKAQSLVVKASSVRGNQSTDRYSLNGFADALARVRKECP